MTGDETGLAGRVIEFAHFLKQRAFKVFQSSVLDALRGLAMISLEDKRDFFYVLRANLTATDLEWIQFKALFDQFWDQANLLEEPSGDKRGPEPRARISVKEGECLADTPSQTSTEINSSNEKEWLEGIAYSPVSVVRKKDLGCFNQADIPMARLALRQMTDPFKIERSRRIKRGRHAGNLDFRRTIRQCLKTGGTPFTLFYKEKKKRLKRLVILADVSGSMDRYARFVMPFLLGLREIGSGAEVFVFSTSLTSITFLVRRLSLEKALERIADQVPDWSGGTRIGYSLHQFNQAHAGRLLNRRTVVVILSDGWDLGGKDLLRREMAFLSRRTHTVLWLNPLAADPDYEPLCRGMKTALPYIDHLLPANNLQSLQRVARLLSRAMIH
ncbi:MAG: hypothetical protein B5M55_07410 [Desulfococcus sp. 4484_242]|nr:MAG: hypothetical protein B5M55_07410 [Desulfococcus sp. 4484_242]